jgi:hypothetical protein
MMLLARGGVLVQFGQLFEHFRSRQAFACGDEDTAHGRELRFHRDRAGHHAVARVADSSSLVRDPEPVTSRSASTAADLRLPSGSVTFNAGDTTGATRTLTIEILNDTTDENDETFSRFLRGRDDGHRVA